MQQTETSRGLALKVAANALSAIVQYEAPDRTVRVLVPSVGDGALLIGLLDYMVIYAPAKYARDWIDLTIIDPVPERIAATLRVMYSSFRQVDAWVGDFLSPDSVAVGATFNLVLMAPPADVAREHVERAWDLLASGGRLVAIIPGTATREMSREILSVATYEPVPDTNGVRTGILVLNKP